MHELVDLVGFAKHYNDFHYEVLQIRGHVEGQGEVSLANIKKIIA